MDSWAENDWLSRFKQLAGGRTAIIITHRFTTAMHAETIHVMDNGRIIESGSHEELINRNGLYAKLHEYQKPALLTAPENPGSREAAK